MDKATICNMALRLLTDSQYTEGTPGHEACDLYFTQVYNEVLSTHYWTWARRRVKLEYEDEWGYVLPQDCLRVEKMEGLRHWGIFGNHVQPVNSCDVEGRVWCTYISSILANRGEVPDSRAKFINALVLRLAARICNAVSADDERRLRLEQQYRLELDNAIIDDVRQDQSNDQDPLDAIMNSSITGEY